MQEKGADKVVLLGILVLTLVAARILVAVRGQVNLSEPVELTYTGISAPLPEDPGWTSQKQWEHFSDSFSLTAEKVQPRSNQRIALFRWRYWLTRSELSASEQLGINAAIRRGSMVDSGSLMVDSYNLEWARIEIPIVGTSLFVGVINLDNQRRLELTVEALSSSDLAEHTFFAAVEKLTAEPNNSLANGVELIQSFQSKPLDIESINGRDEMFFIMTDENGYRRGFLAQMLGAVRLEDGSEGIGSVSVDFSDTSGIDIMHHSILQSAPDLSSFSWRSRTANPRANEPMTFEMQLEDNTLRLSSLALPRTVQLKVGPAAISEDLYLEVAVRFLKSDYDKAMIDLIYSDGRIMPTLLEKKVSTGADDSLVMLKRVDQPQIWFEVFFDEDMTVARQIVHQSQELILKPSNINEIVQTFPMWESTLLQLEQQLAQ